MICKLSISMRVLSAFFLSKFGSLFKTYEVFRHFLQQVSKRTLVRRAFRSPSPFWGAIACTTLPDIANVFQIWSTLAAYEKLDFLS